jgi:phosphosulfolactate phosphohydrolase-like enzyme
VKRSFVIDCLPESAGRWRATHAIVGVDVFRAATVIVTALAGGHAVYPVGSLEEASTVAGRLRGPLLVGEQAGIKPDWFDHDNSPAVLERQPGRRPVVLLTSAGTLLLTKSRGASAIYVASLRNFSATARALATHHRVALIGAGTRGLPRDEDQLVCAWIGDLLLQAGYGPQDERTLEEVERWRGADPAVLGDGPSAAFLRGSGQDHDIAFVLTHIDDVDAVAAYNGQRVSLLETAAGHPLAADAT